MFSQRSWTPWIRRLGLVAVGLLAAVMALARPEAAKAWHWKGHLYSANQAAAPILAGRDVVEIDGHEYPVAHAVADAIRSHPNDYRGGVVGPDGFPDIVVGQGSIHPDTRTNNGESATPDMSAGHSFTWEWLAHVYQSGWSAYNSCGGCDSGKRALAFAYGYLTHAAGDVWAHTLINSFARGVFPGVGDIAADPSKLGIAIRHIVVESYIEDHTSGTDMGIDIPQDFVFNTFIGSVNGRDKFGVQVFTPNPTAVSLGQGALIGNFVDLYRRLVDKRDFYDAQLEKQKRDNWACGQLGLCDPVWLAKRAYLNAWIDDVIDGLKAYPQLNLDVARKLAGEDLDLPESFHAYVGQHLLSMLGFPDFVGAAYTVIHDITEFIAQLVGPLLKPIEDAIGALQNWVFKAAFGITLDELKDYLKSPTTYINLNVAPVGLPPTTSATLDKLMGLATDGVLNPVAPFDPSKFAAMQNSVVIAKLTLLDGNGLNALLSAHGVANHYAPTDNIMLGWARSIDADHQWRTTSPRDGRRYGEGTFFLWEDCTAREKVFRVLFRDWETGNFPASDCAPPVKNADLSLAGKAAPRTARKKKRLKLTFVVLNSGPDAATKVKLVGSVPVRPLAMSAVGAGASCTGGRPFTCSIDTLASGQTMTVSVIVRPVKVGKFTAVASVSGSSHDAASGNDRATLIVKVKR